MDTKREKMVVDAALAAVKAAVKAAVSTAGHGTSLQVHELISGIIAFMTASKGWTEADNENLARHLEQEVNHLRIGMNGQNIIMPLLFGGVWDSSHN